MESSEAIRGAITNSIAQVENNYITEIHFGDKETKIIEIGGIDFLDTMKRIKTLEDKIKQLEYTVEALYHAPPGGGPGFRQSMRELKDLNNKFK